MKKATEILKKTVFIALLLLPALIIQGASQSPTILNLTELVRAQLLLYAIVLLIVKTVSIVYPPLPGAAFTIASIPLISWKLAYAIDLAGSTLGASIAFFLGSKHGYSILKRAAGKTIADKVITIKLKQRNQIEAALFLRIAAGGMLSDGLAWGASLIGFRYLPFILGYIISHLITTLPIFYLLAVSLSFNSWMVVAAAAVCAWLVIFTFKGRYFE